ncbi:thiolase-like protein [Microdochium bolleyi]|uniref:Thiolase-like protein n=1 Tax=Microdochium bolleyi TaxID=196109 RepID=A0A136IKZ0_9PEZI|nr:thiolase-like protein [Microdochium bolleyi]
MASSKTVTAKTRDSLLFGWQALSLDEQKLTSIRREVLGSSSHSWIIEAIADLPAQLPALKSLSKDFHNSAESLLGQLIRWLQDDDAPPSPNLIRYNTLLTPLTIVHQLLQYSNYLEAKYPSLEPDARFEAASQTTRSSGLCTGLISAFAVSSATDVVSYRSFGAVALRMAVGCGLVVDQVNQAKSSIQTRGLVVRWPTNEARQALSEVLSMFPEAYRSVLFDEDRATITVPRQQTTDIKHELSTRGLKAVDVNVDGRFHWPCHSAAATELMSILGKEPMLQSHHATSTLDLPVGANTDQDISTTKEELYRSVIRSVLLEAPDWHHSVLGVQKRVQSDKEAWIVTFGTEKFMPPSLMRSLKDRLLNMTDVDHAPALPARCSSDSDIAVVGMACKVAGADDLDEFWQLLCKGESQHQNCPEDRFKFTTPFRQDAGHKQWFGNFINDHDTFDHKFFNKTPREVASMDPQQRQFLQVAYQAVQQSGYYRIAEPDKRVGCYVGMSAVDYENNVASHAPTAYSATGTLRGFVAGKVSHFFGWTGPGLTLDTACSSSAVAVHLACQAILNGECSAAVAGGVNIMTSPLFFQNLAGASFLSKTGQCRPFDAAADGYCRGEGCGAVFLKKLSAAIADGDDVHGVIAGTAVQQNENCTPIVVPNIPSLSDLFKKVIAKSKLRAEQIGVVEAHGTGTPVGDPAEYDSIRKVLGGRATARTSSVMLGSVKGLVGHLEATSGIVSLIKSLLMIRHGLVPPQASFSRLNPAIQAVASDLITIPTAISSWTSDLKAVLINNYGASGSNASLVVIQPPERDPAMTPKALQSAHTRQPFQISGHDGASIAAYAMKLRGTIANRRNPPPSLEDISIALATQSNPNLPQRHIFIASTIDELDGHLAAIESGQTSSGACVGPKSVPVVLCFGGQIAQSIGLDRELFESVPLLRKHLNMCDEIVRCFDSESIYPHIFQHEVIEDIVTLQTCLFAMQYASAQAWIECGIRPAAVVGHSFGELTAMAVAGEVSLDDAIKIVIARARLIRDQWPSDKGCMLAVEAGVDEVRVRLG